MTRFHDSSSEGGNRGAIRTLGMHKGFIRGGGGGKVSTKWSKYMETCMFECFHVTFGVQITIKHLVEYLLHLMLTLPVPHATSGWFMNDHKSVSSGLHEPPLVVHLLQRLMCFWS